MTDTHADLIDRLKAGSGHDHKLNVQIALYFGRTGHEDARWRPYTSSLDACIGLMREVLPGWVLSTFTNGHLDSKYLDVRALNAWRVGLAPLGPVENPFDSAEWPKATHTSAERALLIAILQAAGTGEQ